MKEELITLDLYAEGFQQMLPVLLEAYYKAKTNNLLENELNAIQEEILPGIPTGMHEVISSIRGLAS